ncbi:MAG: BrnA antitoxin family protein [Candidatus Binataceae bacterium]
MSVRRIFASTRSLARHRGTTDWARLDAMTDREIERAVAADPDAPPIMSAKSWRDAVIMLPGSKVPVSLRIDPNVLRWFKAHGRGYQTLMNEALTSYMFDHLVTDRAATAESNRRAREETVGRRRVVRRIAQPRNGTPNSAKIPHARHPHL